MHRATHIFDINDLQHLFKSDNLEKIVELDNFTTSFKLLNYYKKDIEIHKTDILDLLLKNLNQEKMNGWIAWKKSNFKKCLAPQIHRFG